MSQKPESAPGHSCYYTGLFGNPRPLDKIRPRPGALLPNIGSYPGRQGGRVSTLNPGFRGFDAARYRL